MAEQWGLDRDSMVMVSYKGKHFARSDLRSDSYSEFSPHMVICWNRMQRAVPLTLSVILSLGWIYFNSLHSWGGVLQMVALGNPFKI